MYSRRQFLKFTGSALAGVALASQFKTPATQAEASWPEGPDVLLGRVAWPWGIPVLTRPRPEPESKRVRVVMPDEIVVIRREIVGLGIMPHNHVWYELDDGFIYSSYVVPTRNHLQAPLTALPAEGVWGEVNVPYVDGRKHAAPNAPVLYRLYSTSVYKVQEILPPVEGKVWYRVGTEVYPNIYAPAEAFRIITPEELTPISPNVADKRLVVGLTSQTFTAYEGQAEVYRSRLASGAQWFGEDGKTLVGGTPPGIQYLWSKRITRQMQGGTPEEGYDLPGIPWVAYFSSHGEALHSTYWHNDFGRPKSHGCINLPPEAAKWLFRWTAPSVAYQPGEIIVDWEHRGTAIDIRAEA